MMTSHEQPVVKQRLDMGHGFMKSVIRNQIDRDNYDKEVKAKQQQGKPHHRQNPSRPKKPEMQTYVPPQRTKKESSVHLFTLEYEHKDGEVYTLSVAKNDVPDEIARGVGNKYDLPETFIDALAVRIQEEINKRSV